MKKRTAAEWRGLISELTAQRDEQQGLISSGEPRRRKHAFAASQNNEAAAAALRKIKADDDEAREKIQNLSLAIDEAQQNLDAAQAAEQEDEDQQRRERISELADALIEIDVKFVKALRAVNGLLDQRTRTVAEIATIGADMLGMMQMAQLRNEEGAIDAIFDVLSSHLGNRRTAPIGAAAKLISHDCSIFGKPSPVPPAPMTAAEKERRRALDRPVSPLRQVV